MSMIKITTEDNKEHLIKGRLTFRVEKVEDEHGNVELITRGKMTTHYYFEDIKKIETDRYVLKDIDVYAEEFASNDFDILYNFLIDDYDVKGGITNLSQEIISKIEEEEYKNEDSNKWERSE